MSAPSRTSPPPPGGSCILRRPAVALTALAVLVVALFLLTGLPGKWEYALGLRGRTIAGMVIAAAAVGVATVLFQTITANRILTPGIMGFDAIFLAIQVLIAFLIGPALLVSAPPLASWIVELVLMAGRSCCCTGGRSCGDGSTCTSSCWRGWSWACSSVRSLPSCATARPRHFAIIQNLAFASFTSIDRDLLVPTGILVVVAVASLWPIRRSLDVLALGEATAVSLGVEHRRVVMHAVVAIAAMVAASTALVGPVTFFGLLVATLAYGAVGHRHMRSIPAAIAIGVIALVGGQLILDRVLGFGTELPVVIEFAGGVFFIILVLTGRARYVISIDSVVKRHGSLLAVDDVDLTSGPASPPSSGPTGRASRPCWPPSAG